MLNFNDNLKIAAIQYYIELNNLPLYIINIINNDDIIYIIINENDCKRVKTYELNTFLKNLGYKKSDFYNFLNYINNDLIFEDLLENEEEIELRSAMAASTSDKDETEKIKNLFEYFDNPNSIKLDWYSTTVTLNIK